MIKKFQNLNKWYQIAILAWVITIVFMIIGLACMGAKGQFGDGMLNITYNCFDITKHGADNIGTILNGSDGINLIVSSTLLHTWQAGITFAVILTPIFAAGSILLTVYALYKNKKFQK